MGGKSRPQDRKKEYERNNILRVNDAKLRMATLIKVSVRNTRFIVLRFSMGYVNNSGAITGCRTEGDKFERDNSDKYIHGTRFIYRRRRSCFIHSRANVPTPGSAKPNCKNLTRSWCR